MPTLTNSRSRLLGGGRLAVPVPALGAELLTNGNLETWASATDAGTWLETIAGTSTVNREATDVHGGTYAMRSDTDGSNNSAYIRQNSIATAGRWYLLSVWAKVSVAGKLIGLGSTNFPWTASTTAAGTTNYAQYLVAGRASGTSLIVGPATGVAQANASYYLDDISLKEITLASMFSTRAYGTHVTVKAQATIVAGTRAGVVCNLDSATSPANFVIASVDSAGTARLTKCVAGTYTELISTAVTYVAGAFVEIRRLAGTTTYQLWYAGSQVGTDQTIADSQIVSNVLAGMFNTWSGNTLTGFSCVPSA